MCVAGYNHPRLGLQEFGYDMWWRQPALFNKDNFAGNPENVFGGTASGNMLCLQKRLPIEIAGLVKVPGVNNWYGQ